MSMIEWDFYSKRRRINLVHLIVRNNIESYEHLKDFLLQKGVTCPPKATFQAAYAIAVPPVAAPTPAKRKRQTKTTTQRTKKATTSRKRRAAKKSK